MEEKKSGLTLKELVISQFIFSSVLVTQDILDLPFYQGFDLPILKLPKFKD